MGGRLARIKRYVGIFVVAAVFVWFGSFAFRNPDMTQTRLLLTYWPHYLAGLAVVAVGMLLVGEVI